VPTLKLPKTLEPSIQFDYDHILTLLSTPISLLIQTLLVTSEHRLTADTLVRDLSIALGHSDSQVRTPPASDDLSVISQILHAHYTGGSTAKPPSLDSFILKSHLLRQLLEGSVQSGYKDQWEAVRRLREGVMRHVELLEAAPKKQAKVVTPEVSGR
jgi:hypothetical protein